MVFIGRILRTRGIKGEVIVGLSPGLDIPGEGIAVELKSSKYQLSKKIAKSAMAGGEAIVTFAGIDSINEALKIVGYSLYGETAAPKKKRLPSLLGFSVYDGQGNCWGMVQAQPQYSLNQLLEVVNAQTGETVFVPWHAEIVKKIDRRAKIIVIDPPRGLLELNR